MTRRGVVAATLAVAATPILRTVDAQEIADSSKSSNRRHEARPWLMLPPTPSLPAGARSETARLGDTALWFADYGDATTHGGADPVLFLHGGLGHSAYWGRQIADVALHRRVVAMDTRGHGQSPMTGKELSYSAFATDVDALLDHLHIPRVAIVGWSDGAVTAMQLAMTKPDRVSGLFLFGGNATNAGLILHGSKTRLFETYVARCHAEYVKLSPTPNRWGELSAGLHAMWRREPNFDKAALGMIKAPTTVAASQYDEIIRQDHAQLIAQSIHNARLIELKDVSHFAMLQNPGAFNAALQEFVGIP